MESTTNARVVDSKTIELFGANTLMLEIGNLFGVGTNLAYINLLTPYGQGNIPPDNANVYLTPISGSSKRFMCIGAIPAIPTIPHDFNKGESWSNSLRYILAMQNDGIRAYRETDEDFNTTLPNGEAFVQMMLNRITELESMIETLNQNYASLKSTFNSHMHSGVQTGGSNTGSPTSQLSQTNIPTYSTLDKDKTYLNDGKALIDDNGEVYA